MENIQTRAQKYYKEHKKHGIWLKVVTTLASITLFCTVYALIMPATTQSADVYCGFEEHTEHTDECYEEIRTLICGHEEGEAIYADECYEEVQTLICGREEGEGHTHADDCYAEVSKLTCGLEEREGHTHTDDCYEERSTLICTDEDPEHVHDEGCYTTETVPVCGLEECEPHTHDESCYTTETVPVCGMEECEPHTHDESCYAMERVLREDAGEPVIHVHDESCYQVEKVLKCEKEIHVHTLQCFSNPEADVEDTDIWDASVERAELTGVWADDLLAVAETQLGYAESTENYTVLEDGETMKGYSRYGDWYGDTYGDWCAMFVSFCLNYSEIPVNAVPYEASCPRWVSLLSDPEWDLFRAADEYTPVKGDLIFFDYDQDGTADHVGIVSETVDTRPEVEEAEEIAEEITEEEITVSEITEDFEVLEIADEAIPLADMTEEISEEETEEIAEEEIEEIPEEETEEIPEEEIEEIPEEEIEEIPEEEIEEACHIIVKTIEGNSGDRVSRRSYRLDDEDIMGYAILPENVEELPETTIETVTEDGMLVTLTGRMPEGSEVLVEDLSEDVLAEILAQMGAETSVFAYDITIVDGEGNKWQPDELGVDVSITGLDMPEGMVEVAHVPTAGVIELVESRATEDGIVFKAPGFSPYVGAITVPTTNGTTTVNVSVIWSQEPTGQQLVATLYKDGVSTGKTITLERKETEASGKSKTADSDNWAGQFTDLEPGSYEVQYSTIDGYVYSSKSMITEADGGSAWKSAATMESGQTYVLVHNTNKAVQVSNSALSAGSVTVSGSTLTGTIPTSMQWTYDGTGLKNVGTGQYLKLSTSASLTTDSSSITYENSYLSRASAHYSDNRAYYLQYNGSAYACPTTQSDGTKITLYNYGSTSTSAIDVTITGVYLKDAEPKHQKYIDAFRDGIDNPDTDLDNNVPAGENINDLYRLYLDVGPEANYSPLDIVFVLDVSSSMCGGNSTGGFEATDLNGNKPTWRCWALDTMMNGEAANSQTPGLYYDDTHTYRDKTGSSRSSPAYWKEYNATQHQSTLYANGLISKIADLNPDTNIAVVTFCKTATVLTAGSQFDGLNVDGWVRASDMKAVVYNNDSGTNYVDALQKTDTLLSADKVANDGRRKVVIFISDGWPTYHNGTDTTSDINATNVTGKGTEGEDEWNRAAYVIDNQFKTADYYGNQIANGMLDIYTVSVGDWNTSLLDKLSTNGTTFMSTDFREIIKCLDTNLTNDVGYYTKLSIYDELSEDVDFYRDNLDFVVQKIKTDDDGNVSTAEDAIVSLYDSATGELTEEGAKYIRPQPDGVIINYEAKTVQVNFRESYVEEGNTIFRVSFNVKTTQRAYDKYAANLLNPELTDGYGGNRGDPNTDYIGNTTSSKRLGFDSNNQAFVEYSQSFTGYEGETKQAPYDDPVVQVKAASDDSEVAEPTFNHKKTIDYLGDNAASDNPDTNADDADTPDENLENLYRLYLDMTGKQEPIDLLIAVDTSEAMNQVKIGTKTGITAVKEFLNGTSSSQGFLDYFYTLNENNRACVIEYFGASATMNGEVTKAVYDFHNDSKVLMNWANKSSYSSVGITYRTGSGSNYEAGLKLASEQFAEASSANHKKIMIFISGGVPTYFMVDSNDKTTAKNGYFALGSYNLTDKDINRRGGTGSTASYTYTEAATKRAVDDFTAANPTVYIYPVGVSDSMNPSTTSNADVLKYMAEKGSGQNVGICRCLNGSAATLRDEMKAIFFPKGVVITDELSKYVRYYAADPDVRVTMYDKDNGTTTVLYEDGQVKNTAILSGVTYTEGDTKAEPTDSTGKVVADFSKTYQFEPRYTYTLSFNVQTTLTAEKEYAKDGYNVKGDKETDYGTNTTSSQKAGFHSNDSATVAYSISGKDVTEPYDHPVVQVDETEYVKLTVTKTVSGRTVTKSFPFELTVTVKNGESYAPADLTKRIAFLAEELEELGVTLKENTTNVLVFSVESGSSIELDGLIPKGSKVNLTETAHEGYSVTMSGAHVSNHSGDSFSFDLTEDAQVDVLNTAGIDMPATGGSGTALYTFGGTVLLLAAGALLLRRRREADAAN